MYVKSMILDGFKSYAKRVEINGFDKEFNAITGFNGTGKSNILDAICFVLGITNLSQVRAGSLQDLVYKSGQAGVKRASVTITFDNHDRASSPLGYEDYKEIVVTRQVVIDGKNKYMINGSTVTNKRVQDMFCSVQLNVNNPHFLIMQGRITKVVNMKPMEILSMIEEAVGTKMYETKKQVALVTLQKKDNKLNEINTILEEEIGPKITKLKEEKTQYVEFQRIERELEHCKRVVIAWKYLSALSNSDKAQDNVTAITQQIDEKEKIIADGRREIEVIEDKAKEITERIESEQGQELGAMEQELKEAEKRESKLTAESNSSMENIKSEKKVINQLKTNLSDDENLLANKEKEFENVGGLFKKLKDEEEADAAAVLAAQESYQKISVGLLQTESGENATLEQQIITANQTAAQAQTVVKQSEMTIKHIKEQLSIKEKEFYDMKKDYQKDNQNLKIKEKELEALENELTKLNHVEGLHETLQNEKTELTGQLRILADQIRKFESRQPQMRFEYKDPIPNFRRESVKGMVCKLITLKDGNAAYALDVAAGGKLYGVIVDTHETSKALLERGQLEQRVTFIPLNKINGKAIDRKIVDFAQNLVGKENVQPALSLVNFPEITRPAMLWIFGQTFIAKDMEVAKKVAFHPNIMRKCVTLEGDVYDPAGTLSGGATPESGSILLQIEELKKLETEYSLKKAKLQQVDQKLMQMTRSVEKYTNLKEEFELRSHEVNVVKQRFQQSSHHQIKEQIDDLKAKLVELTETIKSASVTEKENTKRVQDLKVQLKDASSIREKQLKNAENQLKILQKKAEKSRKEWEKREQESGTLNLEITEIRKAVEAGKEQLSKALEKLDTLEKSTETLRAESIAVQENVKKLQQAVQAHKEVINQRNKEIKKLLSRKEDILKQSEDFKLEVMKLNHEINSIKTNAVECKRKMSDMMKKYQWIEQDKAYFGKAGGIYDFDANNPEEIAQKMRQLESSRDRLRLNINTRAMDLLNKEEEQYTDMLKKKRIVEADKIKIFNAISHFDAKKKESLLQAWEQVNRDFGSIFSSLLPGANAKLQPPENQTVLDGLEVKVGFNGVYKDSLGELSGGQRSLVALSLILAMLLFKPAPLYILDEVDAALDLAHTENIGAMLKKHFKHSQFIVVSLKDGMFNNANVLFKTCFVDGMSTITRTERSKFK